MIIVVPLVVVLLLVALSRRERERPTRPRHHDEEIVAATLQRAVAEGVLTAGQATAVLELVEPEPAAPTEKQPAGRVSPVYEVLGYLGAIFVAVGAVTLVAQSWDDLGKAARVSILGVVAATLTAAGLAVRNEEEPVLWRLRGVLLLFASGAVGGFTGVLTADALELRPELATIITGAAVTVHAALLWGGKDRPAQHLACLGGVVTTVSGVSMWTGGHAWFAGAMVMVVGVAWLAGSLRQLLPPAFVGAGLGAALMLVGAGIVGAGWDPYGVLVGLATAAGLIAAGIVFDQFLLTGLGVAGSFVYLPGTLDTFFGDTVGAPVALLFVGVALLVVTMWLLRGQWPQPRHP